MALNNYHARAFKKQNLLEHHYRIISLLDLFHIHIVSSTLDRDRKTRIFSFQGFHLDLLGFPRISLDLLWFSLISLESPQISPWSPRTETKGLPSCHFFCLKSRLHLRYGRNVRYNNNYFIDLWVRDQLIKFPKVLTFSCYSEKFEWRCHFLWMLK